MSKLDKCFTVFLLALALFGITAVVVLPSYAATVLGPTRITASPLNVVLSCTRYSGVAPLGIICNTIGSSSTLPAVVRPFSDLQTTWTFGDPGAGNFTTGSHVVGGTPDSSGLASKNVAAGPIAGHVFETPSGTPYVVTATVTDGTNTQQQRVQVTVTDPNTVYTTTGTACASSASDYNGCPSGATQLVISATTAAIASATTDPLNVITTSAPHGYTTCQSIATSNALGTLPGFVSNNTMYYAKVLSPTTVKLFAFHDDCVNNVSPRTISSTGTGGLVTGIAPTIITDNANAGRRVLFKKGEAYTVLTSGQVYAVGPITIGAYGTGANPQFTVTGLSGGLVNFVGAANGALGAANDIRLMDLDLFGGGTNTEGGRGFSQNTDVRNLTILRTSLTDSGILYGSSGGDTINLNFNDNVALRNTAFFGRTIFASVLGNAFGPVNPNGLSEHLWRTEKTKFTQIASNTMTTPLYGKLNITIRSDVHVTSNDDTQYVNLSDNKLTGLTQCGPCTQSIVQMAMTNNTSNDWHYDMIAERNHLIFGPGTVNGFLLAGAYVTIRNNIINMDAGLGGRTGIRMDYDSQLTGVNIPPSPSNHGYFNNTIYYANAGSNSVFTITASPGNGGTPAQVTDTTMINNLGYSPLDTSHRMQPMFIQLFNGSTMQTPVQSNNSCTDIGVGGCLTAGGVLTNPVFASATPVNPVDYKPTGGSYAIGAGIAVQNVLSDFFLTPQTGTRSLGAIIP